VDSHVYTNYFVPPNYDSMIGKIIVHGDTREQALARMRTALSETVVEGIHTNIPLHRELMVDAKFVEGGTDIHYLAGWPSDGGPNSSCTQSLEPVSRADGRIRPVGLRGRRRRRHKEKVLFRAGMPAGAAWDRSTIKALFETETTAEGAATLLLAQPWAEGLHVQGLAPMPEQDWVRLTQSQFQPVEITPEFWIVPSWHEPP
jgi:acetyl/propionyl-CoA carboxylase alpha subunit